MQPLRLDMFKKFYLRPLNPSDERRLQEFFYSQTKETIKMRYNYTPGPMTWENPVTWLALTKVNMWR